MPIFCLSRFRIGNNGDRLVAENLGGVVVTHKLTKERNAKRLEAMRSDLQWQLTQENGGAKQVFFQLLSAAETA